MKRKPYMLCAGGLLLAGFMYAIVAGWPFAGQALAVAQDFNLEAIGVLRSVQGFLGEQRQSMIATVVTTQSRQVSPFTVAAVAPKAFSPSGGLAKADAPGGQPPPPVKPVNLYSATRVAGTFGSWSSESAKRALVDGIVLTVGDRVRGGWTISEIASTGVTFTRNGRIVHCRIGADVTLDEAP